MSIQTLSLLVVLLLASRESLAQEQEFPTQGGTLFQRWSPVGANESESADSQPLKVNLLLDSSQIQENVLQSHVPALHRLPSRYQLTVPRDAFTQSIAFGPQFDRQYSRFSLFMRPTLGASRDRILPYRSIIFPNTAANPLAAIVPLVPGGLWPNWAGFYGFGGGAELAVSKNFSVRGQMDVIYNYPFNDILSNGSWTYRYSIAPIMHKRMHKETNRVAEIRKSRRP
ncbi:MAG: hypothetical protein P4K80_01605 [Acidobacteriaceae bacterium]|nr:hypothetical protein [Acidobacteriaceae bacterium]